MNILIITAHPSTLGYTHKIAEEYKRVKEFKGNAVQMIDVFSKNYEIPLLKFESIRDVVLTKETLEAQKLITWANEIVFIHPIWWGMFPAVLKNFIDNVMWKGFAYKYTPEGKVEKLLAGKTAKVFATCGGPSWIYKIPFLMPLKGFWKLCLLDFVGVELIDFRVLGNLDKIRDEDKKEKMFKKFLRKIAQSAEKIK